MVNYYTFSVIQEYDLCEQYICIWKKTFSFCFGCRAPTKIFQIITSVTKNIPKNCWIQAWESNPKRSFLNQLYKQRACTKYYLVKHVFTFACTWRDDPIWLYIYNMFPIERNHQLASFCVGPGLSIDSWKFTVFGTSSYFHSLHHALTISPLFQATACLSDSFFWGRFSVC